MIDEDLYKIATDELNSNDRKADVWARACALASDDHDEARFLYTNLRVEEMLNKDGRQRTFSTSDHHRGGAANGTSSQESQATETDALSSAPPMESLEQDEIADNQIESSRAGVDSASAPLPGDRLGAFGISDLDAPTSTPGTDTLSDKVVEFDDETMAELAALSVENGTDTSAVSNITGKPVPSSQSNENAANTDNPGNNKLGESVDEMLSRAQTFEAKGNHASTSSIDNHSDAKNDLDTTPADHLTTVQGSTSITADANTPAPANQPAHSSYGSNAQAQQLEPELEDHDATTETAHAYAGDSEAASSPRNAAPDHQQNEVDIAPRDYADAEQLLDNDSTMDMSTELDTGVGRSYSVFNKNGALKAVKRGVSWPALLFTFPWLLSKALFGTALVYGCLWLVSVSGLLIAANRWISAGADASMNIKLWTGAFALLAIISLLYIPFRYGNRWVAEKLQNRGFDFKGSVSAQNKIDAVARLIQANQEQAR